MGWSKLINLFSQSSANPNIICFQQHVNQDTSWDIPGSPEPSMKLDASGAPPWKPNVNNGTELWEANLRNGGQPPPQPQQKTPWGHTPSTNIGGTWGEDDDAADSSNVWTGVPSGQQQWGNAANNGAMWGGGGKFFVLSIVAACVKMKYSVYSGPKKENDWANNGGGGGGGGGGAGNIGLGDPRSGDPRATGMDPRDMRPDPRDLRWLEQNRLAGGDMRGDPRGKCRFFESNKNVALFAIFFLNQPN